MTWLRTTEVQTGRDGDIDLLGVREYTRSFRIEFDAAIDGPRTAISYVPVSRFDAYTEANGFRDNWALATKAKATKEDDDNCFNWIVTVAYTTEIWRSILKGITSGGVSHAGSPPGGEPSPSEPSPLNPVLRPARFRWGSKKYKQAQKTDFSIDADGAPAPKAWVNSAGDKGDPPYEAEETDLALFIERNELPITLAVAGLPSYSPFVAQAIIGKINDATFLGFEKDRVYCDDIVSDSEYENGFPFWKVSYSFTIRGKKAAGGRYWDVVWLDQGTHEIVAGERRVITDKRLVPVTMPVPLDGTGKKLPEADVLAGNFKYRTNSPYQRADFSVLRLP